MSALAASRAHDQEALGCGRMIGMNQTPRLAPLTVAERTAQQREMIERIGSEFRFAPAIWES